MGKKVTQANIIKNKYGQHYLIELIHCDGEKLKFVPAVKKVLLQAAKKSKAKLLKSYFHQFRPFGVSGVLFIKESHFSIHTWPEDNYAGVDIQTCGFMYPQRAIEELKNKFYAQKVKVRIFRRGELIELRE